MGHRCQVPVRHAPRAAQQASDPQEVTRASGAVVEERYDSREEVSGITKYIGWQKTFKFEDTIDTLLKAEVGWVSVTLNV